MIFVFVAFALSRRARWDLGFTLVTLLGGTVPILSFWAERRATRRVRRGSAPTAVTSLTSSRSAGRVRRGRHVGGLRWRRRTSCLDPATSAGASGVVGSCAVSAASDAASSGRCRRRRRRRPGWPWSRGPAAAAAAAGREPESSCRLGPRTAAATTWLLAAGRFWRRTRPRRRGRARASSFLNLPPPCVLWAEASLTTSGVLSSGSRSSSLVATVSARSASRSLASATTGASRSRRRPRPGRAGPGRRRRSGASRSRASSRGGRRGPGRPWPAPDRVHGVGQLGPARSSGLLDLHLELPVRRVVLPRTFMTILRRQDARDGARIVADQAIPPRASTGRNPMWGRVTRSGRTSAAAARPRAQRSTTPTHERRPSWPTPTRRSRPTAATSRSSCSPNHAPATVQQLRRPGDRREGVQRRHHRREEDRPLLRRAHLPPGHRAGS